MLHSILAPGTRCALEHGGAAPVIVDKTANAFHAAIYTKDLSDILDTSNKLNATAVMVNDYTVFRVDWMPFGGRDNCGVLCP